MAQVTAGGRPDEGGVVRLSDVLFWSGVAICFGNLGAATFMRLPPRRIAVHFLIGMAILGWLVVAWFQ